MCSWRSSFLGFGLFCRLPLLCLLGLLLFYELRDELLILLLLFLGCLVAVLPFPLDQLLPANSFLGDQPLNLGSLVVCFLFFVSVFILDILGNRTMDDILSNIIFLLVKVESGSDVVGSLFAQASGSSFGGYLLDLLVTLFDNFEHDDSKIWAANASTNGSSCSFTSSAWLVTSPT